jgi:hypothetical protein
MEGQKGSGYSKLYYSLGIAASITGMLVGGYFTFSSLFGKNSDDEKEDDKAKEVAYNPKKHINMHISPNFEKELIKLKSEIAICKDNIPINEDNITKIAALIKEYADFHFESRNRESIYERRKILYDLTKSINNSDLAINMAQKYQECCSREYYDLYSFSLNTSRKYVMKTIKLKSKKFNELWEQFSHKDEFYYKINFYTNLFNNLIYDENIHTIEFIEKLFEDYSIQLIYQVGELEKKLISGTYTEGEKEEVYVNELQILKLRLSDEMYIKHKLDDKTLKYIAITKFELDKKDEKYKNYLEKVNGIDLISIGL